MMMKTKVNVVSNWIRAGLSLLILLFSPFSQADILGKWEVDAELTIAFNRTHSHMGDLEGTILKCFSENSFLQISKTDFSFVTKEHNCSFKGKEYKMDHFESTHKYSNVFENDKIAILISKQEDGSRIGEVLHKIGRNTLWVYYAGESPEYDSHSRYYYRRVPTGEEH
jgi:hypothetical protein